MQDEEAMTRDSREGSGEVESSNSDCPATKTFREQEPFQPWPGYSSTKYGGGWVVTPSAQRFGQNRKANTGSMWLAGTKAKHGGTGHQSITCTTQSRGLCSPFLLLLLFISHHVA